MLATERGEASAEAAQLPGDSSFVPRRCDPNYWASKYFVGLACLLEKLLDSSRLLLSLCALAS